MYEVVTTTHQFNCNCNWTDGWLWQLQNNFWKISNEVSIPVILRTDNEKSIWSQYKYSCSYVVWHLHNVVFQLLKALTLLRDAHVIHCDLKPENILLTRYDFKSLWFSLFPKIFQSFINNPVVQGAAIEAAWTYGVTESLLDSKVATEVSTILLSHTSMVLWLFDCKMYSAEMVALNMFIIVNVLHVHPQVS